MSARKDKDWVAEMFSALRDCGEDISIVFGRVPAQGRAAGEIAWHELPHDGYDGVSGLDTLLRQYGVAAPTLPTLQEGPAPWLRRMRGVLSVLPYLGIRRQQWALDYNWQDPPAVPPPAGRVAWTLLDAAQTQAVVRAAKAAGVTVNTYLLSHLDAAVRGTWTPAGAPRRWMLPVNLRGAVVRPAPSPPHMSFLTVDIAAAPAPSALQAQIQRCLDQGQHWGMWSLLQLGRLLGEQGMRKDIRSREKRGHGATGMFSNLGVWNVGAGDGWVFCPAITRVYPIGAGCITVDGRMALTLQLHHALGGTLQKAQSTLDAWVEGALGALPARVAPQAVAETGAQTQPEPA